MPDDLRLGAGAAGFTPERAEEQFKLERAGDALFRKQERAMFMETLSDRQAVTLFAIPAERGIYRGFDCGAIAASCSNADIVASLDVNAGSDLGGQRLAERKPGGSSWSGCRLVRMFT